MASNIAKKSTSLSSATDTPRRGVATTKCSRANCCSASLIGVREQLRSSPRFSSLMAVPGASSNVMIILRNSTSTASRARSGGPTFLAVMFFTAATPHLVATTHGCARPNPDRLSPAFNSAATSISLAATSTPFLDIVESLIQNQSALRPTTHSVSCLNSRLTFRPLLSLSIRLLVTPARARWSVHQGGRAVPPAARPPWFPSSHTLQSRLRHCSTPSNGLHLLQHHSRLHTGVSHSLVNHFSIDDNVIHSEWPV